METLEIAGRKIGPGEPPYIIAEIGANHNGDIGLCEELIDAARQSGADAVKFQSWSHRSLISKAEYERNARLCSRDQMTLQQAVERYQLTPDMHFRVAEYCRKVNMTMFSSCFSREEVDLLESIDVPAYKIASMDVNYLSLLEYVAALGKPVILSTGLASLGEIERAVNLIRASAPVALLHCVSIYPSPAEIVHLNNMRTLRNAFDVQVGYSDHTLGISVPLASIALGATIIEKHFTLDKNLEGWDHAVSADPAEMSQLVREGRQVVLSLGSYSRSLSESQLEKRKVFRRCIVVRRQLRAGQPIGAEDIDYKRPGTGIHPDEVPYVLGRMVKHDLCPDHELSWRDLN